RRARRGRARRSAGLLRSGGATASATAPCPRRAARSCRRLRLLLDAERQLEDVPNGAVVALEDAERAPAAEHEDPVGDLDHLLELRGREEDREPLGGELVDDAEDLRLRADVDAGRRL